MGKPLDQGSVEKQFHKALALAELQRIEFQFGVFGEDKLDERAMGTSVKVPALSGSVLPAYVA
jgi:hypothetical protein